MGPIGMGPIGMGARGQPPGMGGRPGGSMYPGGIMPCMPCPGMGGSGSGCWCRNPAAAAAVCGSMLAAELTPAGAAAPSAVLLLG